MSMKRHRHGSRGVKGHLFQCLYSPARVSFSSVSVQQPTGVSWSLCRVSSKGGRKGYCWTSSDVKLTAHANCCSSCVWHEHIVPKLWGRPPPPPSDFSTRTHHRTNTSDTNLQLLQLHVDQLQGKKSFGRKHDCIFRPLRFWASGITAPSRLEAHAADVWNMFMEIYGNGKLPLSYFHSDDCNNEPKRGISSASASSPSDSTTTDESLIHYQKFREFSLNVSTGTMWGTNMKCIIRAEVTDDWRPSAYQSRNCN